MARDKSQRQSLGGLYKMIKESRVLLIGAGGVGCELLKNLVLTGFGEIHIIDLDTIDLSNLNRQFLFRREHIKKPKALVAKEAAHRFNPNVKIEAHHANIKDAQFNIDWFTSFALVFNALDNLDARRHVNKMCLSADVPLVESGTTGFKGQVQVIKKGRSECYDCNPKTTQKTYPICTIRSTPSQPIHCIVWAKSYLLPELFGLSEDEPEMDTSKHTENREELENLRKEAQALKKIRESMGAADFAKQVFDKVFKDDIERLRNAEGMWDNRKRPESLSYDIIHQEATAIEAPIVPDDQREWTQVENFAVFKDSLQRLSQRYQNDKAAALKDDSPDPVIAFDKDDDDTLDFVASAANLRSQIFSIERKSKFNIKQMAGNIIPAIATTNAMTAGLCVMQAFKVLKGDFGRAKTIFLEQSAARALSADILRPPNPDCPTCSMASSRVHFDPARATLNDLVQDVLKLQLGYGDELTIMNDHGPIYEPDLEDMLEKKFAELDISTEGESFLTVIDDDEENPRVNLQLAISAKALPVDSKPVVLLAEPPDIARKPKKAAVTAVPVAEGEVSDGAVRANGAIPAMAKRKREVDDDAGTLDAATPVKKVQQVAPTPDVVTLEDAAGEGAILIE